MADNNNNIEVNPLEALLNKHKQATQTGVNSEVEKTNTTSAEVMHPDVDIDVDDTPVVNTTSETEHLELPKHIPAVDE